MLTIKKPFGIPIGQRRVLGKVSFLLLRFPSRGTIFGNPRIGRSSATGRQIGLIGANQRQPRGLIHQAMQMPGGLHQNDFQSRADKGFQHVPTAGGGVAFAEDDVRVNFRLALVFRHVPHQKQNFHLFFDGVFLVLFLIRVEPT